MTNQYPNVSTAWATILWIPNLDLFEHLIAIPHATPPNHVILLSQTLRGILSPWRTARAEQEGIMADDQISLPYFIVILILMGFIVRYLFFNGAGSTPSTRSPEAALRARELAAERIQQMFPQVDRRTILWDLQRNAGNIQNTTERILAGRLETVSRVFLVYATVVAVAQAFLFVPTCAPRHCWRTVSK